VLGSEGKGGSVPYVPNDPIGYFEAYNWWGSETGEHSYGRLVKYLDTERKTIVDKIEIPSEYNFANSGNNILAWQLLDSKTIKMALSQNGIVETETINLPLTEMDINVEFADNELYWSCFLAETNSYKLRSYKKFDLIEEITFDVSGQHYYEWMHPYPYFIFGCNTIVFVNNDCNYIGIATKDEFKLIKYQEELDNDYTFEYDFNQYYHICTNLNRTQLLLTDKRDNKTYDLSEHIHEIDFRFEQPRKIITDRDNDTIILHTYPGWILYSKSKGIITSIGYEATNNLQIDKISLSKIKRFIKNL
jgi:hypothetical protein